MRRTNKFSNQVLIVLMEMPAQLPSKLISFQLNHPNAKGKLPHYLRNKLEDLQEKFDKLENIGVFRKPEDVVEYLNPSFLVSKPDKSKRLVKAFTEVGKYTKTQPSLPSRCRLNIKRDKKVEIPHKN